MSFVYNSKLPFYSWGHADDQGSSSIVAATHGYQQRSGFVHLAVPLSENGARKSWNNSLNAPRGIASTAPFENCPCDAQMPWKQFAVNSVAAAFGLTLHGEVYQINCAYWMWNFEKNTVTSSTPRIGHSRVARWRFSGLTKPIKAIFNSHEAPFRSNNSLQRYSAAVLAIDVDGSAWWLVDSFETSSDATQNVSGDGVVSIALPKDSTAKFIHYGNFVSDTALHVELSKRFCYVLTTSDNKTYVRREGETRWYALTTGCVEVIYPTSTATFGWATNNTPTATVSAPNEATGTTATATVVGFTDLYNKNGVQHGRPVLRITDTGEGYTQDATVTFSRAADDGTAPAYKLKAWQNHVVRTWSTLEQRGSLADQGQKFLDNTGRTITIREKPATYNDDFSRSSAWLEATFTATTVFQPPATATNIPAKVFAYDNTASYTSPPAWCIGQDEKLYKYNASPGAGKVAGYEEYDAGPWAALCCSRRTFCGVTRDGKMYTWGVNGTGSGGATANYDSVFFGDGSEVDASRSNPTQIASSAEWVSVWQVQQYGFVAIRKDAICRDIDQPMEYWPDWHFGG